MKMSANETEILEIGPAGFSADATSQKLRGTRDMAATFQMLHGDYHEAVMRGNAYAASNQAAQAVSVALATTYTGLCLSNPAGSNKVLSLLMVGFALTVAPAAIASIHLIGGYTAAGVVTHTAAVTPENLYIGQSGTPAAKVDSQATIPTPTYKWSLSHGFTAAALPGGGLNPPVDTRGLFLIGPGGFIAIGALTAVTGFGCMAWEELPLSGNTP